MGIVLNEYEWAERALENKDMGSSPTETLSRISRYYYANHYSKKDIRQKLDAFILQCDPYASLVKWSGLLDKVSKSASKYPLIKIDGVPVTTPELDTIISLKGKRVQRLAFTLLCAAKYWDLVSDRNDHWVNCPDKDIMRMANLQSAGSEKQSEMFYQLKTLGLLRFSKKIDNLNVQVRYIEPGDQILFIQDFRNLGYQYEMYLGGDYFVCCNCGIVDRARTPGKGRHQKYCTNCAAEVKTRQNVNSVMKLRKRYVN